MGPASGAIRYGLLGILAIVSASWGEAAEDQVFDQEETARLTEEVRRLRASVSALSLQLDKLESIGRRPALGRPSSWLQGG